MTFYYCDVCHYCFEADAQPDRCPDCGKTMFHDNPAVRLATEREVADLLRVRAEDAIEQNLTACG